MIRFCGATIVVLAFGLSGQAADSDAWFPERIKDFGTVPRGPMLTHYYRVNNPTDQPIQIGGVRVSCGCVTVTAPQPIIPPGQNSAILAQMDTRRFVGAKTVTIYVTFIKPRFEEVALQVTAFAREDFMIHPDTIAFGQVAKGQTKQATVRVSFYGDPNWRIEGATSDSSFIKPTFKAVPSQNTTEVGYELTAELGTDIPVGKWFTDVWLKTSNPSASKIRVPLTVEIVAPLTVIPSQVQFGVLKQGDKSEQRVILKGLAPFKIMSVLGMDDGIQLVSPMGGEAKPVQVLTFSLDTKNARKVERKLTIVTDMGSENEIVISAVGEVLIGQ